MRKMTQQESEMTIFGSGCLSYSWQVTQRYNGWDYDPKTHEAPDSWAWLIGVEDPQEDKTRTVMVTHSVIMGAIRRMANGEIKHCPDEWVNECRNAIFNIDACDMDANCADAVLQVATLGEIAYG